MNSINKQNVTNISISKPVSKFLLQPIISTAASRAKETTAANTISNFTIKVNKT